MLLTRNFGCHCEESSCPIRDFNRVILVDYHYQDDYQDDYQSGG